MVAMVYTPALNWRVKARMSPRLLLDVRCMRMRSGRLCMPVGVCWYSIRPPIFQDAPLVFPRVRPVNGCRLRLRCPQGSHDVLDAMTGIGVSGALRGIAGAIASSLGIDGVLPTSLPCRTTAFR